MNYILKSPLVKDDLVLTGRDKLKLGQKMKVVKEGNVYKLESINTGGRPDHLLDVERSSIQQFSSASRSRLIREIASYGSLVPVFVTLTYGKEYPSAKETKAHLKAWWRRITKKHPDYFAVWKLEFQKRGAPHYHLLVYSVESRPRIDKDFLKRSWWKATGVDNLRTEIKRLRSHRGGIWYATKYLAKTEVYKPCPTDNDAGPSSSDSVADEGPGRFWGIMSRKNKPKNKTEFMLSPTEYKYLLSEALNGLARFLVKQDLAKINDLKLHEVDDFVTEDLVSDKAQELVRKSRVPVHLLSDEIGLISRVEELARITDETGYEFMTDYFKDL